MTTVPANISQVPTDLKTGLTLPLSKHLDSLELAKHRALLAMECEFLAKKVDRFGWERDRNTPAQDRIKTDFMDALQDIPIDEVRDACRAFVIENPSKTPHEGHIVNQVNKMRRERIAQRADATRPETREEREAREAAHASRPLINPKRAAEADAILQQAAFSTIPHRGTVE